MYMIRTLKQNSVLNQGQGVLYMNTYPLLQDATLFVLFEFHK